MSRAFIKMLLNFAGALTSVSRAEKGSWSVLLYGAAGCGKTHLLSRLRRWLNSELDTVPSKPAALFVAVRMETGRGMIWRHLRRRFAEELSQTRADGITHLDAMLQSFAERFDGNLVQGVRRPVDPRLQ